MSSTALLIGATGLVGRACLDRLLAASTYDRVVVFARRSTAQRHAKLTEVLVDFAQLDVQDAAICGDDVFVCLGTTLKTAGSREAFRRIDHDYVLDFARRARARGARRLFLVSSIGADAGSRNFYLRTKGELEHALAGLGYAALVILRPGLLVGERSEQRAGEAAGIAVARVVAPLFVGALAKVRPIAAETVARALVGAAQAPDAATHGVHIKRYPEIIALARQEQFPPPVG